MTDKPVDQDDMTRDMNESNPEQPVEGEVEQPAEAGQGEETSELETLRAKLAEKDEEVLRMAAEMQ
ncbi:MAG TPA: hypothetical protein ENO14_03825, partial [Chromatiales bacterium]|nr:hypothetical protein [Chromatiales bacterium]